MKQGLWVAVAAVLLTSCASRSEIPQLHSHEDTLSWALGESIALSIREMGEAIMLDNKTVQQAIEHTLAGGKQPLSDSAFRDAMNMITFTQQTEQMRRDNAREAEVNRQQDAYFAQLMVEHPAVRKHPSGFYYEVLQEGSGRTARYGDRVSFDYRSFLMFTGEPYDQTYGKRKPILHVVGKPMFQGLVEGLQLMRTGSIYRFYFPYQLAFGPQGSRGIEGFTPFIYEVEIHEIFDD